ncbi:class I SAM-dependent methyltransferase [Streptomyces sp. NPDC088768]|uniref:class I SAM-dependent methyltransferase n=1 Tax=Streptomyces sp. NPDC088768 TaxID=3365894 RepID=UPI00380ECE50
MHRADMGVWLDRKKVWKSRGLAEAVGRESVELYGKGTDDVSAKLATKTTTGIGASVFDPVLTEAHYTWYAPTGGHILDPFAGGPARGIVAGHLGYRYTGIDLSAAQLRANAAVREQWADDLVVSPSWMLGDSAAVLPTLSDGCADYVFTCPPYHNLERYSKDPADLSAMTWETFANTYRRVIAESVRCMAEDSFATWIVGEVRSPAGFLRGLVPLTVEAHEAANARFYNDCIMLTPLGTAPLRLGQQWRPSRKAGRVHQYALTFVKGDPKRATAKLPRPERY